MEQAAAAAPRRRRKRKSVQQLLPVVQEQQPGMSEGGRIGLIGVGALGVMAAAYYVGRKLMSTQLPKVQKVSSFFLLAITLCWLGLAMKSYSAFPTLHERPFVCSNNCSTLAVPRNFQSFNVAEV